MFHGGEQRKTRQTTYVFGLFHITLNNCEEVALFLRFALPSTILRIRQEKITFWEHGTSRRNIRFSVDRECYETGVLHGRGFICNRMGFDAVTPLIYTAPVKFVIRTGSFWKRFLKWSIFKTIRFHWSCKRRNRFDLKTVWRNWQAREVNMVNLAWNVALCCTITTLIRGLTSLLQLPCILLSINREAYRTVTGRVVLRCWPFRRYTPAE